MIRRERFAPRLIAAACGVAAFGLPVRAEDAPTYEIDQIVVTASRIPTTFSDRTRSITVISREEIATAPIHDVADLLDYVVGVDARQRGPHGVQTDVGMRGSTFEQVLVLVDGVKVTDPQTGHHALDLVVALDDIERIEVLRGHGSRLFGPNAFGGVINIITRERRGNEASLRATYGEHAFAEGAASGSYLAGPTAHRLSLAHRRSDGYRHNTDFTVSTASYGVSLPAGPNTVTLSAGYADRRFGANSFYAGMPNEWEHTRTYTFSAAGEAKLGTMSLSPRLSWRRHEDEFLLDRDDPTLYRNTHTTDVYDAEGESIFASAFGVTAFGGEVGTERITSTKLGRHERTRGGFFIEHRAEPSGRLTVTVGGCAYRYTGTGWQIWPGADLGVQVTRSVRLYSSVGRAFRVPTYTELYYEDPRNVGNPGLKPERAWSYEGGIGWTNRGVSGEMNAFVRDGRNLIDYVRNADTLRWEARNITEVRTRGIEATLSIRPTAFVAGFPLRRLSLGYAFLDSEKKSGDFAQSKYVLNHLRHQGVVDVAHSAPYGILFSWKLRYEARVGGDNFVVVDARASREVGHIEVFLEATNLFGASYEDRASVPQPGRWVRLGAVVRVGKTP